MSLVPPLLKMVDISKHYPGVIANQNINLSLSKGEILALLGENGAGKSTLVKMIYGVTQPTSGSLIYQGESRVIKSPNQAKKLGIGMVFQHFSVFETLTVTENIALGLPPEVLNSIHCLKSKILELSDRFEMKVDPDRYVHSLSIGERQRVEILRCLVQDVKLLILDEPTSVLTPQEVTGLFKVIKQLASQGCSILFISHKLNEVTELCDRAIILRGGQISGKCTPKDETPTSIAKMMVGDETLLSEQYPKNYGDKIRLSASNLNVDIDDPFACGLKNINLKMYANEIVGIAGVAGNGQDELLAALSGENHQLPKAVIQIDGQAVGNLNTAQRRELGMAYVPTERLGQGAVPDMSLEDNTLLTLKKSSMTKFGIIIKHKIQALCESIIDKNQVKCRNSDSQAKSLSGGNLQKFIIGREIEQQPSILICSHPTWGVDIGAASAIHRELIELRDQGTAIIVISEDIDELFMLSDRICALYEGRLSETVKTADTSLNEVGQWIAGDFSEQKNKQQESLQYA